MGGGGGLMERGVVKSLEFWPVNVMFGRRFPFLPSNWRRGILVFKGEGGKKASEENARGWGVG